METNNPAYQLYDVTRKNEVKPTFFYADFKDELIREVNVVEEKTTQFRIEDNSCFVGMVNPEELCINVNDAIKKLGRDVARVVYLAGGTFDVKAKPTKENTFSIFKFSPEHKERQRKIRRLEHVLLGDTQVHIDDFEERSLSDEILKHLRMNSYAREKLPSKLDNQALIHKIESYMEQIPNKYEICSTYEESLLYLLLPELLKRYKEISQQWLVKAIHYSK